MSQHTSFTNGIFAKARTAIASLYEKLMPFKDGSVFAIHRQGRQPKLATWKSTTSGPALGGLVGLLVQLDSAVKYFTAVFPVPSITRKVPNVGQMTQISVYEDSIRTRLGRLLDDNQLDINVAHPENVGAPIDPARRIKNGRYWTVDLYAAQAKKVGFGDLPELPFEIGHGDNYISVTALATPKGSPSVVERLVQRKMLPKTIIPTWEENAGKLGKYLYHTGIKVDRANINFMGKDFGRLGPKSEDGTAYASMRFLPQILSMLESIDVAADPKAVTLFNKAKEVISLGLKHNSPIMLKMWTSGPYAFGKGMVVFLPDHMISERFGSTSEFTVFADGNFCKYVDSDVSDRTQPLFLHDVRIVHDKAVKVGLPLLDRMAPVPLAFDWYAKRGTAQLERLRKKVQEKGISWLINSQNQSGDLDEVARFVEQNGYYGLSDVNSIKEKITTAVLERVFTTPVSGMNLYAAPAFTDVAKDEVLLHPIHAERVKDWDYGLVVRFPLLNPAGVKWLRITLSELAPLNGAVLHPDYMGDLAMDYDGDGLTIIASKGIFKKIHKEVFHGQNITMGKALKGAFLDTSRKPTALAAVVRAGVAQHLMGLADTALSVATAKSANIEEMLANSIEPACAVQATVDAIKKVTCEFADFHVKSLGPSWRLARCKSSAISDVGLVKGVYPIAFGPIHNLAGAVQAALYEWTAYTIKNHITFTHDVKTSEYVAMCVRQVQEIASERTSASILIDGRWVRPMVDCLHQEVRVSLYRFFSSFKRAEEMDYTRLISILQRLSDAAGKKACSYLERANACQAEIENAYNRAASSFVNTAIALWGPEIRKDLLHLRFNVDEVASATGKDENQV